MDERKYLIVALRYWKGHENVLFWGKNRSGYTIDLSKVGVYTKEEAKKEIAVGDCYISLDKLGITQDMLDFKHDTVMMVVPKTQEICDYVNTFAKLMKHKDQMTTGMD